MAHNCCVKSPVGRVSYVPGINAVTLGHRNGTSMAAQELQQQDDALDLQSQSLTTLPALPTALRILNLTRNRIPDLVPCGALVNLERLDAFEE